MMTFHVISIFHHILDSYLNETLLKRASESGVIKIVVHDLRDYTQDKHRSTDDTPTGGGPGMVMKIEPIFRCLASIRQTQAHSFDLEKQCREREDKIFHHPQSPIILLSPRGRQFSQAVAETWVKADITSLIFICGRYEGVDQRVSDYLVDYECSIGPYVLSGGELPALVMIETITRLLPDVLGNKESLCEESFAGGLGLEYPQYTKPTDFCPVSGVTWSTPPVLLSGHHNQIKAWRLDKATRHRL